MGGDLGAVVQHDVGEEPLVARHEPAAPEGDGGSPCAARHGRDGRSSVQATILKLAEGPR